MTPEVLFDLVFLLLFTLCEVLGILYYLAPLRPCSLWRRWGWPLLLIVIYYCWNILSMTSQQTRDIYSILYVLETYFTLRILFGCIVAANGGNVFIMSLSRFWRLGLSDI